MRDRIVRVRPRDELVFRDMEGVTVPTQPWPQTFVIARTLFARDAVEVRPLTLAGLTKGIAKNAVSMSFWRVCWLLRGLGFLKTEECARYHWRDLTLRFWRHQHVRRFRLVRASGRVLRRCKGFFVVGWRCFRMTRSAGWVSRAGFWLWHTYRYGRYYSS